MDDLTPQPSLYEEKGAVYSAFMNAPPPPVDPYEDFKNKNIRSINRTAGAGLIQFAVLNAVQIVVMIVFFVKYAVEGTSPEKIPSMLSAGFPLLLAAAISYITANPVGTFSGLGMTGRTKEFGGMFRKPGIAPLALFMGCFVTFFIQNVSGMIQQIVSVIIQSDGISGTALNSFVFSDDAAQNIVLIAYVVFIGPITEEFLFRGMALKNLSCTDVRFGMVMSSLMFGMFHGNIMQFIIAFFIGMFFAYIDVKAGSIIPSIIFHILNNGMACVIMYIDYVAPELTETFSTVYLIAAVILGAFGTVIIFGKKKNTAALYDGYASEGKNPYDPIYTAPEGSPKTSQWKFAAKAPCMWIFTAIYVIMIIFSMLPQTAAVPTDIPAADSVSEESEAPADAAAAGIFTVI